MRSAGRFRPDFGVGLQGFEVSTTLQDFFLELRGSEGTGLSGSAWREMSMV